MHLSIEPIKPLEQPWAKTAAEVLQALEVDSEKGLSRTEAHHRLKIFGQNVLKVEKKISHLQRILAQFKSPVVIVLLIATLVTGVLGDTVDSVAIAIIVLINTLIGFFQEVKAEAAVTALKKLSAPRARVLRDSQVFEVPGSNICVGDILILEAGDFVSADCRILVASQVSADEAILTGESLPVKKTAAETEKNAAMTDRKNMLFASTALATGSARAVVTATNMNTEIGHIAGMLETGIVPATPLQAKLKKVSNKLLIFCGVLVLIVAALGIYQGEPWMDVMLLAVSLAVAAIPEGLPTVVTLALTMAVSRMTKRNAIVKHLPAVETLGSTNVICTDKTGTLTTGKMQVREAFTLNTGITEVSRNAVSGLMLELIKSAVLCSNASLSNEGVSAGDPTEAALLHLAKGHGVDLSALISENPRLAEWSFDSERKRMSVAVRSNHQIILHCKGAPESILPLCLLNAKEAAEIQSAVESLSQLGRRILLVARKTLTENQLIGTDGLHPEFGSVEQHLTFLGFIAIADPPRKESIKAIAECKAAGIKVVMITGDHPITAKAIANELGIFEAEKFDQVLTGTDLNAMTDEELRQRVEKTAVYARVTPEHKLKIIRAWQSLGNVVAMTGDGVNDAPALKQASIGIAMGSGGTEVARQASSMILTDDNFATIVSAVEEGRAIYGNIRRTIQYLLSGNLAEILIMLGAAVIGWPAPLAPIHLLWINLVTDGLPALALAAEPVPKNVLTSIKRPSPISFFDQIFYREMVFVGLLTAGLTLAVYGYSLKTADELTAKTHAFTFLVFAELLRSFASRSEVKTFFQLGLTSNIYHLLAVGFPVLFQIFLHHNAIFREIFKVKEISWYEGILLFLITLIPLLIIETKKFLKQRTNWLTQA